MPSDWDVNSFYSFWRNVQGSMFRILKKTEGVDLTYRPKEGMHSIRGLFTHIASAYHWWLEYVVHDGVGIEPPDSVPDTVEGLEELLRGAHRRMWDFLDGLEWGDFHRKYEVEDGGEMKEVDLLWIIWHIVEHDIHHRAQIGLYLRLNGIRVPPEDFWNQPVL